MCYEEDERYLVSKLGTKHAKVKAEADVLVISGELSGALTNAVMVGNVVQSQEHVPEAAHEDTQYNWHTWFGHQSYDAIEVLAATPGSVLKLTDRE